MVIPDGAADLPIKELGNRTAFQAAATPNLDALAALGTMGVARTTPPNFDAGSDVCSMSLLGYDPARYHTGRAPLEAASLGVETGPSDWIFRLNLVTTGASVRGPYSADPGTLMIDHSAGAISDGEARLLIDALIEHWNRAAPDTARAMRLTPGVSYRNILVDASGRSSADLRTTPPHEIPGEAWEARLPFGGPSADVLTRLMLASRDAFRDHPVNIARLAAGKRPATMAWIWGQGLKPSMPSFKEQFGMKGAMITAVDLLAGIASCIGWDRLRVPGVTSYHDTDYAAQGRAAVEAVTTGGYDIVCCHVEAPDEASHQADWKTKVAAIEAIDRFVIAPVADCIRKLEKQGEGCRALVMPDHYTLVSTRKHDATPVPFLIAGAGIRAGCARSFDEQTAGASGISVAHGHDLMSTFLRNPGSLR